MMPLGRLVLGTVAGTLAAGALIAGPATLAGLVLAVLAGGTAWGAVLADLALEDPAAHPRCGDSWSYHRRHRRRL